MALEKKMILDVEGGTRANVVAILRHEPGHVVTHAYQLHRRRGVGELFGRELEALSALLPAEPASRNYVQHLRLWYAQSHPMRTSPRLSRCGCGRARTGARATPNGPRSRSSICRCLMARSPASGRS